MQIDYGVGEVCRYVRNRNAILNQITSRYVFNTHANLATI